MEPLLSGRNLMTPFKFQKDIILINFEFLNSYRGASLEGYGVFVATKPLKSQAVAFRTPFWGKAERNYVARRNVWFGILPKPKNR